MCGKRAYNRALSPALEEAAIGFKLPEIGGIGRAGTIVANEGGCGSNGLGPAFAYDASSFWLVQNSTTHQLEHNKQYNAYYPQSVRKSQQQGRR